MRGLPNVNVELPKSGSLRSPFGTPKFAWLKMLKKLAWNVSFTLSVILNFLWIPKSKLTKPGAFNTPRPRPELHHHCVGLAITPPLTRPVGHSDGSSRLLN